MNPDTSDSLSAFEETDDEYVYNDVEARLEQVVSVDAEYDGEGIPEGTVTIQCVSLGETVDVNAESFDRDLHCGERTIVSADVIENSEEIMVEMGRTWMNEMRVLGPDHEFGRVDHAETVRDLFAAEEAYEAASAQ